MKSATVMQWIREVTPKLDAMRDAALVAAALERRTHCRTAVVDDIMASWLTNLRATRLEIERDRNAALSEQLESLFAWLLDVLQRNRYFVEQWKVFPADWKVPVPRYCCLHWHNLCLVCSASISIDHVALEIVPAIGH